MIKLAEIVEEIGKKQNVDTDHIAKIQKSIAIASDYLRQHFQSSLSFEDPW